MTHYVYVFWDGGRALYVGMTGNLARRMREHDRRSPWAGAASHVTVTAYPERRAAQTAEGRTIYALAPAYNRTCNPRYWTAEEIAMHERTPAACAAKLASLGRAS